MRVLYVAKHGSGGGDDEGAISFALTKLGHDVRRFSEREGAEALLFSDCMPCDFLLFHHWHDYESISRFRCAKVMWCFDLVDWPSDPTLADRNEKRRRWMDDVTPLIDLGFMTDGDHVAQDKTGKLVWLMQGADERVVGIGDVGSRSYLGPVTPSKQPEILFTGTSRGGQQREAFVANMRTRYDNRFLHVERGIHGRALADLIARSKIVVAPDSPVTSRYWSNRVYNSLGFGACLVHPEAEGLKADYNQYREVCFYRSRKDMHDWIALLLERPEMREGLSSAGMQRTISDHLYRHRCQVLVETVKERLGL